MRIAAIVFGLIGLWGCGAGAPGTKASPAEAKAYVRELGLSDVEMKAAESFGGQQLVEITGNVTNKGGKALKRVELTCVFYDPYNQQVLREVVPIVRDDRGGLKPGETKPFRLPFDNLPKTWNQAMPNMVMAGLVFE
ncbi:MAG: DUF2393 domain-containing protein [Acidobacteria bacterium]|nr:DUF2393 domain-containing protein [Acidobacteriota bacterium]